MKAAVIILTIVTLGLTVTLLVMHNRQNVELKAVKLENVKLAQQEDEVQLNLTEARQLVEVLQTNLETQASELISSSNELVNTSATLKNTQAELASTQAQFHNSQAELQQVKTRYATLQREREGLSKEVRELEQEIAALDSRISEAQTKLANAEGDRETLLAEVKRLQEEKALLTTWFNDITAIRGQLAKLKEEQALHKRITWIRKGIYGRRDKKGAEVLLARPDSPIPVPDNRLTVEVEQGGESRVVSPTPPAQP